MRKHKSECQCLNTMAEISLLKAGTGKTTRQRAVVSYSTGCLCTTDYGCMAVRLGLLCVVEFIADHRPSAAHLPGTRALIRRFESVTLKLSPSQSLNVSYLSTAVLLPLNPNPQSSLASLNERVDSQVQLLEGSTDTKAQVRGGRERGREMGGRSERAEENEGWREGGEIARER